MKRALPITALKEQLVIPTFRSVCEFIVLVRVFYSLVLILFSIYRQLSFISIFLASGGVFFGRLFGIGISMVFLRRFPLLLAKIHETE